MALIRTGFARAGLLAGAIVMGRLGLARPGFAQSAAPPDTAELMTTVRDLAADSMEGRRAGTSGGARARRYLADRLRAVGADSFATAYEHAFRLPTGVTEGVNLVALVPGTSKASRYLVLSAHYDHLGVIQDRIYPGADDNASGVAAALVLAREARQQPLEHSLLIVLFDAEEPGLLGARAFMAAPPVPPGAIALDLNLDMVSHSDSSELWVAGVSRFPVFRPAIDSVRSRSTIKLLLGHDQPGVPGQQDWTEDSDQGAFFAAGIPFLYFGVEDHEDYHRPSDRPETIHPLFFAGAVATIRDALVTLDRSVR